MRFSALLVIVLLTASLFAQQNITQWQDNGIPVRQGENVEWARSADVTTDGNVVYVWSDTKRGDRDVWAQKLDHQGNLIWGDTPILVNGEIDRQEDPVNIATSDGGCIFAWIDFRNEIAGDIYAQKVNADGDLLWDEAGVPLCVTPGIQLTLNIVPDNSGGAYIIWDDSRNAGGGDIYGVHVDANGSNVWAENGAQLAGGNGEQASHTFWEDGQGGAILAYVNTYLSEKDLYVKHILTDGTIAWTTTLCDVDTDQDEVKMCPLGNNTFGFAWRDRRNENDGDIYAQACDIDGNLLWTDAVEVYVGASVQENPRVASCGDGTMFVVWQDNRDGTNYADLYVQKLDASGNRLWSTSGVALAVDPSNHQRNPRIVAGNDGDCYVVWDDARNVYPNVDIYMQHVLSNGTIDWEDNGRLLCDAEWEQFNVLIKRSTNYLYVNWGDMRSGSIGIYLQVVDMNGNLLLDDNGEEFYWGLSGDATGAALAPCGDDAYAVWVDNRYATGTRIFVQRMLSDGEIAFEANGIPMTNDVYANQTYPDVVTADNNNLVVVWQQLIEGTERAYCNALDSDGNSLWNADGLALSDLALDQISPQVSCVDNTYYIAWSNLCMSGWVSIYKIYAQKVVDGVLQWGTSGVLVDEADYDLIIQDVVGPYILYKSQSENNNDVFVQRINADGTLSWAQPVTLCDAEGIQRFPRGVLNGDDLFVAWEDSRDETTAVYGQLVHADGTVEWTANGIAIANFDNYQYDPAVSTDGTNYYVAWSDFSNGVDEDVMMQKIGGDGSMLWDPAGFAIAARDSVQFDASLTFINDRQLALWTDFYGPASNIYMQAIDANHDVYWNDEGYPLCNAIMNQYEPQAVQTGDNYAITAWRDARSSGKTEISGLYAQRVYIHGSIDKINDTEAVRTVRLEQNSPNPFNPETTISFSLVSPAEVELTIYNIRGQKVKTLVRDNLTAGHHSAVWNGRDDNNRSVASGVYLYRVTANGATDTKRMILLK